MNMERKNRTVTEPSRFSPTPEPLYRRIRSSQNSLGSSSRTDFGDFLTDGTPFSCELCQSCVYNNRRRGVKLTQSSDRATVQPSIRYTEDGERLSLCLLCSISHDRKRSKQCDGTPPSNPSQREAIEQDRVKLLELLRATTTNSKVDVLVCTESKFTCNCSSNFLSCGSLKDRALLLLSVMEMAHQLRDSRDPDHIKPNGKVGLGNGKKRSKSYEEFVMAKRHTLKEDMGLCEHVTQKILGYSNNFLHKRLVTEEQRNRVSGPAKTNLVPVASLWSQKCCRDHCVRLSRSHLNLVMKWRDLSQESQRGLHQAVAELLTPAAGAKTNCYKFISMVTGCSPSTIAKVSKKLQRNGGVLGAQEHGLRRYWRRKREESGEQEVDGHYDMPTIWTLPQHHPDEIELQQKLDKQSKQLEALKSQVEEQQQELDRQKLLLSQSQSTHQPPDGHLSAHQPPDGHLPCPPTSSSNLQYPVQSTRSRTDITINPSTHCTTLKPATEVLGADNYFYQTMLQSSESTSHVTVSNTSNPQLVNADREGSIVPPNVSLYNMGHVLHHNIMGGTTSSHQFLNTTWMGGSYADDPATHYWNTGLINPQV